MYYSVAQVQTQNAEYTKFYPKWEKIRNVLANDVVKYLRNVGATEKDTEYAKQRQKDYEEGVYFLNFTSTTVESQNGSLYTSEPDIKVDSVHPEMSYLVNDVDGSGVHLIQQVKDASYDACSIGRGLLLPDMPATDGNTSAADQTSGKASPRIIYYPAESILDWRTEMVNGVKKLVWVKLVEQITNQVDEFTIVNEFQYRILAINSDGHYTQRVIVRNSKDNSNQEQAFVDLEYNPNSDNGGTPVKQNGKFIDYIPAYFIGSKNNDIGVDEPPVYSLACLNIAHYRDTADNQEQLFVCSQVMLALYPAEGMSAQEFNEYNPNGIKFGSRQGITLAGGKAELLQAQSTNAISAAIKEKEQQAISIGASITQPQSQVTATTARIQRGAAVSVLSSIADNVSDAYTKALKECARFLGLDDSDIYLCLHKNFFWEEATPQQRAQWFAEINSGILPKSAYYTWLRKRGEIDLTDQEIADELEYEGSDEDDLFADMPLIKNLPNPTNNAPVEPLNNNEVDQ